MRRKLYRVTLPLEIVMVGRKRPTREQALRALCMEVEENQFLGDLHQPTVIRIKSRSDVPRGWAECIPWPCDDDDASYGNTTVLGWLP